MIQEIQTWANTDYAFPGYEWFTFLFGLLWGSFANVCIYRLPRDQKVGFGRSRCPGCSAVVGARDNIPVLSFLLLKGKCRSCQQPISKRYPTIEILSGVLFCLVAGKFGLTVKAALYGFFALALLIVSVIDLDFRIIPDEISVGGIPVGFAAAWITGDISWQNSILGVGLGGGSFLAIAYFYEKFSGQEGLGGGDIKLLAMLGAWLGASALLPIIIFASSLGSVVGIGILIKNRGGMKTAIPFGPFLSLAGLLYLFFHDLFTFLPA